MKKFITIVFIALNISVYAQWELINHVSPILNDVQCITENTVVVVGGQGLIMKSTDGGQNWNSQSLGNSHYLKKVQFNNESVGYILGLEGVGTNIFKTIDGGENWSLILSSQLPDITDISSVNQQIIYVTFEDGSLKKSIDGGTNFQSVNSDSLLLNIQFINENIGYATDGETVLKTINGGINWIEKFQIDEPTLDTAIFYFTNESVGFVKWQNDLYRTTDGGDTFTYLDTLTSLTLRLFAPTENIVWGMSVEVPFNDPILTMRGEVMSDGSFEKVLGWPQFRSIHFINPTLGYGVNLGGEIYKNTTGLLHLNTPKDWSRIKVFPNPVTDFLNISTEKDFISNEITILNSLGSVVFVKKFANQKEIKVDVKSFPKGVYIIEMEVDSKYHREKIIIK
jgi:photosystem II stability/assembly factor-like uncharacterized protein